MAWEMWSRNRRNRHLHGDTTERNIEMAKKQKQKRTLSQALLTGDIKFAGHVEVRGGYYHDMWEAKVDGLLEEGSWLALKRDPNNVHDSNCIRVLSKNGNQIGCVEKEKAAYLAPFMDIGVKMALRVLNHSAPTQPLRLTARLYIKK